ncbi:WYL domain-containing protein [Clostridium sp. 1001283B150210_160208_E6]|uniref:helix-turn-helix transcriptional regulator n=1 Tax=Clostridium sp. 1001283B150210_160208_E6 TaxID=2787129 RepID=UPI00325FD3BB
MFKALNWYVYGYCTLKNDMRVFKLTRIKNLEILEEKFEFKDIDIGNLFKEPELETIEVILRVAKEIKIILEDSLPTYETIEEENNFVTIKTSLPYNNWVDSMILGFGDKVEVLEPKFLREKLIGKIKGMYEMYR